VYFDHANYHAITISLFLVMISMNNSSTRDFLSQAERLIYSDKQFKIIFDNSQEPIVIISGQTALYANNVFLSFFKPMIQESKVTIVE